MSFKPKILKGKGGGGIYRRVGHKTNINKENMYTSRINAGTLKINLYFCVLYKNVINLRTVSCFSCYISMFNSYSRIVRAKAYF